jgi:hypothetical protein
MQKKTAEPALEEGDRAKFKKGQDLSRNKKSFSRDPQGSADTLLSGSRLNIGASGVQRAASSFLPWMKSSMICSTSLFM